ncbi:hypothetical protein ABTK20_20135, partial [Acinetobacter baumannii]
MIRLFKQYVPNAVLLLGLLDLIMLGLAAEAAWSLRASQIGQVPTPFTTRLPQIATFIVVLHIAMVAVGVYGAQ